MFKCVTRGILTRYCWFTKADFSAKGSSFLVRQICTTDNDRLAKKTEKEEKVKSCQRKYNVIILWEIRYIQNPFITTRITITTSEQERQSNLTFWSGSWVKGVCEAKLFTTAKYVGKISMNINTISCSTVPSDLAGWNISL